MSATCIAWGPISLSGWDVLLIIAVAFHGTALAYVPHPRWKAFLLTLPVPFTLANLSLGRPVSATNALGLVLLLGYTYGVYALRTYWRFPITLAIILCAAGYCAGASLLAPLVSATGAAFWTAAVAIFTLGFVLVRLMPSRDEPSHRSPLPVYIKLPSIALVILLLVIIKQYLQGFMTLFPMVGVIASYEGRYCLWTLTRQIPIIMLTLVPMMAMMRLVYPWGGLGWSLAAGWLVSLGLLLLLTRRDWAERTLEAPDLDKAHTG